MTIFDLATDRSFGLSTSAIRSGLTFVTGSTVYLQDSQNEWYLDLTACGGVLSTGHNHPEIREAVMTQMKNLIYCHDFVTPVRFQLQDRLRDFFVCPYRVAFLSSHSEAVELALRLVRSYTNRPTIAVCAGAYHGHTAGALECTDPKLRPGWRVGTVDNFIKRIHYGDGSFNSPKALPIFAENPAAFLIELAQGPAGNIFPSQEYLMALFEYCKDQGILIIVDETMTGFGRTGRMMASARYPIDPDIILLGGGLGSGYPLNAVLAAENIAFSLGVVKLSSFESYGGNAVSMAAALATLGVLNDERLVENSASLGNKFFQGLCGLGQRFEFVTNVRGMGLMLGFDLDTKKSMGKRFFDLCLEEKLLLTGLDNRVRINPPLIFGTSHVERAVVSLQKVLERLEDEL